jgi:hypothetical protein
MLERMVRRRRLIFGMLAGVAALLMGLAGATAYLLRPENFRATIASRLSAHLNLDATLDDVQVTWLPRPRLSGRGLTLRLPNHPELPPFISVERFHADIGLLSASRRHVDTLHVDGLKIAVPPGDARADLHAPLETPPNPSFPLPRLSDIVVDHLISHDAELRFVPRKPEDLPLTFQIHTLEMTAVGFDRPLPFTAELTNPVPTGRVSAKGTVGPWNKNDPDATPIGGTYVFRNADLSTINGIGGILTSAGEFRGRLTGIEVEGHADVPDFSLDLGGRPVALASTFTAVVNGTDGSTTLNEVNAKILNTPLVAKGAITNLAGPGRHDVTIEVHVANGRIEDLLAMVLDTPTPVMLGTMHVDARMALPPGTARVRNRIRVSGRFGLASTQFTNVNVQDKLQELSRRSQGKKDDDPLGRVLTNLSGRVLLSRGVVSLNDMRFEVPGAKVALDGTYHLSSEIMDFRGTLAMQATVSKAVGGFKSIFIKPFDGLFKKDGAGAVLPIRIAGTRDAPKYTLEVGRLFGRGGGDKDKDDEKDAPKDTRREEKKDEKAEPTAR